MLVSNANCEDRAAVGPIIFLTPGFAVTDAATAADFAALAGQGFKAVINNRPDGEEAGQASATDEARRARAAGLGYRHVPASKLEVFTDRVVDGMADALEALEGPVVAHCKSGLRSAMVWAAAEARRAPVADILARLSNAGFDLEFLRDELDQQADRGIVRATVPNGPSAVPIARIGGA
ncbi:MAG: TIGR01244 family sulfur transferase [Hyphomicrobiaceae bacterium]|nr:TIGR01244 family sulfur transferase [Hyphomicrobiaceae bacterium]